MRMPTPCLPWVLAPVALATAACASLPDRAAGPDVVPAAERAIAAHKGLTGPTQNQGVRSVLPVGRLALDTEFPGMQGRELRAREIVVEPGGVVAVHEHAARPGLAYILEGEIVEHRSDHPSPIVRRQGDAAFEKTGLSHWWENRSNRPVRALVVDIVPVTP